MANRKPKPTEPDTKKPATEQTTMPDEHTSPEPTTPPLAYEQTPPGPEPSDNPETVDVLALVDHNPHQFKCGHVYTLPYAVAEQLHQAGVVDAEEAAVASGIRPPSKSVQEPDAD